jgi:hypothetical protein
MSERSTVDQAAGWVALAIGIVAVASVVSMIIFLVVAGPFGFINDVGNALIGILSAGLAFRLAADRGAGTVAVGAAVIGAVVTVFGSWLVMSLTTGFFLAGLVSSVGFALIGAWLVAFNRSARADQLPSGIRTLGRVAGVAMVFGVVAVPGIAMGIDDMDAVPPWLWLFSISWLGTYVLCPAWSIWLGRIWLGRSFLRAS